MPAVPRWTWLALLLVVGVIAITIALVPGRQDPGVNLTNCSGNLFTNGELSLWIGGEWGAPHDPKKVSLTRFVATDDFGLECPHKSEIVKDSKVGPLLDIAVDALGARDTVNAKGELTYSGKPYTVAAQWKTEPRGWVLTSCMIKRQ
jgi:hypothetical protein